jgi:lysophospholipase L1-like esterase
MIDRRGGQEESDRGLSEYRLALSKLAGETGSNLVCYGDVLASHPPREVIGDDGVHPSAAGHAIIAQALLPVVAAACRQRARRSLQKARA